MEGLAAFVNHLQSNIVKAELFASGLLDIQLVSQIFFRINDYLIDFLKI